MGGITGSILEVVIAGLDPAIHGAAAGWMPGSRPGMTMVKLRRSSMGA
ncbi:MAG: hypothetical protein AB7V53_17940 [Dongiaceae bacterium]